MLQNFLKKFPPKIIKVIKVILYIVLFSYLIGSIYISFTYDDLVIKIGIFTFFLFIKKWVTAGLFIMVFLWMIENLHIYQLKSKIEELKERNN